MFDKFRPQQYSIRFKEFDTINQRDSAIIRTVTRAASSIHEAQNKTLIAYPRCRIVSCVPC